MTAVLPDVAADNRAALDRAIADARAALTGSTVERDTNALTAVLAALGISACAHPGESLTAVLRRTGTRTRPVRLDGDWATRTEQPMIAHTLTGEPVALVPRGGTRGYRIHDPRTGETTRATPARIAELSANATAVYRSLGSTPITLRGLIGFSLGGSRRDLALFIFSGLAFGLLSLAVPLSMTFLVPRMLAGGTDELWWAAALLGAVTVIGGFALLVRNAVSVRIQGRLQARLEPAVWDRLLSQDVSFFRQFSTGELVQRGNAIAQVRRVLSDVVVGAALGALFSLCSLAVVLVAAPALGLLLTGALAALGGLLVLLAKRQERHEEVVYSTYGEVYGLLYGLLLGIDKIQAAGREIQAFGRWTRLFRRQKIADAAALREQAAATAIGSALQPLTVAALLGGIAVLGLHPSLNQLIVAGVAAAQVALAIGQLSNLATSTYAVAPILRRLRPLLAQPQHRGGTRQPGTLSGAVRLDGVSFTYPGAVEPTLADVDVHAEPGEMVAIVGPSGAGKSTIVRMLLGFESATAGTVSFDGLSLDELDLRAVRSQIGTVLQNAKLMRGSLFDNIAGPATDLPHAAAWEAAELAGIGDDFRALPMGLETRIGESAEGLSGGQIQRLLIARSLVRRPAVLLLDEATSALDNRTQQAVSDRIAALSCTRIVIAHRLSTIRAADRIYVLDGGRIESVGTFDELIHTSLLFARLVHRQEVSA
jgi:NHLM bacteriocin system ABC transporter ATP-binding protein